MTDSIREQLLQAAAEKEGGVAKMVEKSAVTAESKEQAPADESKLAAEKILSEDVVGLYAESYPRSKRDYYKGRADVYREELAVELEEKKTEGSLDLNDKKAVAVATMEFLKGKRLTKLLDLIKKKAEKPENDNEGEKSDVEVVQGDKKEEKATPKSVKEFEKKGFQISTAEEKRYYTNKDNGIDVEIVGFDPKSQEVTVVFHQEVRVDAQEDGQNVVVFDEAKDAPGQAISYAQFEEKMKGYVLFGPDKKAPKEKESGIESAKEFVIEPGKIFRNGDSLKIKIIKKDPTIRGKIQKGNVEVSEESPQGKSKSFKVYNPTKLKSILEEGGYREVDQSIKVGQKGEIWQKGEKQFRVLRHERDGRKKHDVVIQYADGSGESIPLGDLKDRIEVEGWEKKVVDEKPAKPEQETALGLEKKEKDTVKELFLPYAMDHLAQIENFQWGSGYTKEQVSQLKEIERDRLFNNILKSKLTESGLVRKEVVVDAIELLEEETIEVIAEAHKNEAREVEVEKENNSQEKNSEKLEEDEIQTVEDVFVPYAQGYLRDVRSFDWGEEFTEKLTLRRVQVEEDRFWGSVLPEKMKETTFIRKEAVSSAVEFAKDKVETESTGEKQVTQ